jgi:hypothetical protein
VTNHDLTAALDDLIATITVDCYNQDEVMTAFLTVFEEEVAAPIGAAVLGDVVELVGYDVRGHDPMLVARCRRAGADAWLDLGDVVFEPGTSAAWIHAAYCRCLGLSPHSLVPPTDWTGISWLT